MALNFSDFGGQELRKPDAQGRIIIGKEHKDETFSVERLSNGDILLRPVVGIHKREAWLFANRHALESVERGLDDAAAGRVHDLGSFEKYLTEDKQDSE